MLTRRIIDLYRQKKELPQEKAVLMTPDCCVYGCRKTSTPDMALTHFLDQATDGTYLCLQVYLTQTPQTDTVLLKLREAISKRYRIAVTIGYGPRYLHSTGQLHKGDAGNGLFIQLTSNNLLDVEIPDQIGTSASAITFGVLKSAQALGDRQALIKLDRKIIHFHFDGNIIANVKAMTVYLQGN